MNTNIIKVENVKKQIGRTEIIKDVTLIVGMSITVILFNKRDYLC